MDQKSLETILARIDESNNLMKQEFEKTNLKIDKKLEPIVKRLDELEGKTEKNTNKINEWEREKRKRNIIIFGVDQEEGENFKILEEKVRNLIREKMDIMIMSTEIDSIRRFGKAKTKRPIMITLTTWKRKMEIITNGKRLKGTGIAIKEDFPPEVQEIRKKLYLEMQTLRSQGKRAYIKYDKLVVQDNNQIENKDVEEMEHDFVSDEGEDNNREEPERQKRKAETELAAEANTSKGTPGVKKYLTHQRTSSQVLAQSKLDAFFAGSESSPKD